MYNISIYDKLDTKSYKLAKMGRQTGNTIDNW